MKGITLRELAKELNLSKETVRRHAKKLDLTQKGVATLLSDEEAKAIKDSIANANGVVRQEQKVEVETLQGSDEPELITTKELADSLGVSIETVRKTAINLLHPSKFNWRVVGGGESLAFDKVQALAIKVELQNQSKIAKNGFNTLSISNDLEMILVQKKLDEYRNHRIVELQTELKKQAVQLENQKSKVEFYDNYLQSENLQEIGHLGKVVGIGEIKIFERLKNDGYIKDRFSTDGVKTYDACYNYERFFKSVPSPFFRGEKRLNRDKLMLTHEGFVFFVNKYKDQNPKLIIGCKLF